MPVLSNKASVSYKIKNASFTHDSNITTLNHIIPSMTIVKAQNKLEGISGEIVLFTITLTNTSALNNATNVVLTDDLLSAGYTFVVGSCKVNGQSSIENPQLGISLGLIPQLGVVIVTFDAKIN